MLLSALKITLKRLKLWPCPTSNHLGSGGKFHERPINISKRCRKHLKTVTAGVTVKCPLALGSRALVCHGHMHVDFPRRVPRPAPPAPRSGVQCKIIRVGAPSPPPHLPLSCKTQLATWVCFAQSRYKFPSPHPSLSNCWRSRQSP